jgi:steroid 5-alpha reductase family enzyme
MSFHGARALLGLGVCAAGLLALLAATFAVALRLRKHSVVDVAWGLGFAVIGLLTVAVSAGHGCRGQRLLLTAMVLLWGVRLAWHIGRRNAGHGEDPRYLALLEKVPQPRRTAYAVRTIYLLQGALILFISLPMQLGQYSDRALGVLTWAGLGVWAIGLFFEAVGDRQLKRFKGDPANRGRIMDRGLWRYTRHPNYFGDACVWWGIWLVAAQTRVGAFTVLSPLVMTLLLTKGSGAALTERRMADRPGFADYVARTSGFFPRPPRRAD